MQAGHLAQLHAFALASGAVAIHGLAADGLVGKGGCRGEDQEQGTKHMQIIAWFRGPDQASWRVAPLASAPRATQEGAEDATRCGACRAARGKAGLRNGAAG